MPKRRWSKRRVVSSGFVVIRRFFRFEGAGGAKLSTNASACAIPTMRISMVSLGKAVRSAVSSGRHEMTKCMRKTRSIGPNIECWWKVNEVQIPGTKNALYRAFLDSLVLLSLINSTVQDVSMKEDIGYEAIMGIIDRHIEREIHWDDVRPFDVIGLDEIS